MNINKNVHKYGCLLLSVLLLCTLLSVPVAAEESKSKNIQVGWYEDSYNITGKNGDSKPISVQSLMDMIQRVVK